MALHTYKDEVFAIGSHEGFEATPQVLRNIVNNFSALRNNFRVPLKLGHDDDQPLTDGQPAIGWVDRLELDNQASPTIVFAHYVDMPKIVFMAVKNKMYRSRSIELEDQLRDGKVYRNVLTAVALLGSKLPRVEKLSDLGKYFEHGADNKIDRNKFAVPAKDDASIKRSGKIVFKTQSMEGAIMTPEEIIALQAANVKAANDLAALTAKNAELSSKVEKFASDETARVALEVTNKIAFKRKEVTDFLEKAVKDETITPANRDLFSKVLGVGDDDMVVKIEMKDVEAMIGGSNKTTFSKSETADGVGAGEESDDPAVVLSNKVFSHMEKSGVSDFNQALHIVMRANPKLAGEYVTANGTIE